MDCCSSDQRFPLHTEAAETVEFVLYEPVIQYLLSNAATRQPIYWARADASKLMDGALISAEVKLLKPDPQIHRTFLRKFALRPEECVFIDDTLINVEGALYENMAGIVFNMDVAALAESLRSLSVEW